MPRPTPQQIQQLTDAYNKLKAMRDEVSQMPDHDNVQEQMSPDISTWERTLLKNFSNAPYEGAPQNIQWLKQRHPDLQFSPYQDGKDTRIAVKHPADKQWNVLDPNTGFHPINDPAEAGRDILDGAYLAPQVGAEMAGQAIGGAGGAVVGGLGSRNHALGMLAGFKTGQAAGSGVGGGAMEALRQKLGQYLGINKDVDMGDVKSQAAMSAAAPVVFGAAGAAKNLVTKGVVPMLSGVPGDVLQYTYDHLPELDQLDKEGIGAVTDRAYQKIAVPLRAGLNKAGQDLHDRISSSGGQVSTVEAKQAIQGLLKQYEDSGINNDSNQASLNAIKSTYKRLFNEEVPTYRQGLMGEQIPTGTTSQEIPNTVDASKAWQLQKQIGHEADMYKLRPDPSLMSPRTSGGTPESGKRLIQALDQGYGSLGDGLDQATTQIDPDTGLASSSKTFKDQYKSYKDLSKQLNNAFGSEQAINNTLTNINKKSRKGVLSALMDAKDQLGVDVGDEAKLLTTHDMMGQPYGVGFGKKLSMLPTFGQGASATFRAGMGGTLGEQAAEQGYGLVTDNKPEDAPGFVKIAGALAGAGTFSPLAIKTAIRGLKAAEPVTQYMNPVLSQGADSAADYVGPTAAQSTWHALSNQNSPGTDMLQSKMSAIAPYVLTPEQRAKYLQQMQDNANGGTSQ